MTKIILFCLLTTVLAAQAPYQKKIPELQSAEGLAVMPDGGLVLAGSHSNCIRIFRLTATGVLLWAREICPFNPNADISFGSLHLVADPGAAGGFMLLFRKGAFASAPANLLNLMKFDANGSLIWEAQLKPEKRYGALSAGNQLAITPDGTMWAAHGMGATNPLPDFNQPLVFKVSPSGQQLLRRYYLASEPSAANGIAAQNDHNIFLYGSLVDATSDGFMMQLDEQGDINWSNRYKGMQFLRDGGFFPNGDVLVTANYEHAFALARIRPDGTMPWALKMTDTLSIFQCAVAADGNVLAAGRWPGKPFIIFKINVLENKVLWAYTYEDCSRYQVTALRALPSGGMVWAQSAAEAPLQSRLILSGADGLIGTECPYWETPFPGVLSVAPIVSDLPFTISGEVETDPEHVFQITPMVPEILDCCPTSYPDARFALPDSVCTHAPIDLLSLGNGCSDTWSWALEGATPQTTQGALVHGVTWEQPGYFAVSLTEAAGVCSSTLWDTLRVVEAPALHLFSFADTLLCPDQPFSVQAQVSGLNAWSWEDGSTDPVRSFDPPFAGVFRLSAQNGLCAVSDSFRVSLGQCGPSRVYAPNAFSPNDDGWNDAWELSLQHGLSPVSCQIFDRWGNECYASQSGEMPHWDGFVQGHAMPPGVYVWQFRFLNFTGETETRSGDILLIR